MSSSDYDADLLKSLGAGMMRKIVRQVLKYTVSLKSCAPNATFYGTTRELQNS